MRNELKYLLNREKELKELLGKGGVVQYAALVELRLIRDKIYLVNEVIYAKKSKV